MKNKPKKKPFPTEYEYIGPKEILQRVEEKFKGKIIENANEIVSWILENNNNPKVDEIIVCTFVISLAGKLVIADRHSEHVQCALGENVRSAGEIAFLVERKNQISIEYITNQSTGYCPSSNSWSTVEKALANIGGMNLPESFDPTFVFSYCPNCETRQIVKDNFYFCAECEQGLLSEKEFQAKRKGLEFK